MTENKPQKCLSVAVVGLPNSGKSTLVNFLVGAKISIVSPKAQTTRNQIRGIAVFKETQLVFIDTPGILLDRPSKGQEKMQKEMMSLAWGGTMSGDMILFLVDSHRKSLDEDLELCKKIANSSGRSAPSGATASVMGEQSPVILGLNKIDKVNRDMLLEKTMRLNAILPFAATFMISATTGDGVEDLKDFLVDRAPAAPWVYAEDEITDAPSKFIATEITREQIFLKFRQEIPYFSKVDTEKWEEDEKRLVIHQVIYVARESQKKIIVGHNGQGIKEIGSNARLEMQKFFDKKVSLFLFVKVQENWLQRVDLSHQG